MTNGIQGICWDVDDVVINTTEALVELINQKYRIPNNLEKKNRYDCVDWGFKSLYSRLTKKEQLDLFEDEDFWTTVTLKEGFSSILGSGILDYYNNFFITKGTEKNLRQKQKFLMEQLGKHYEKFTYIGLKEKESKSCFDMTNFIQIDDNYENLRYTNARIKVLLKNNVPTDMNNSFGKIDTPDNLYNINELSEFQKILEFNIRHKL